MLVDTFLATAERAEQVLARPEIAAHWDEPSALEGHTVASLAAHLARAAFTVQRYLDAPPVTGEPTTAAGYLAAALRGLPPAERLRMANGMGALCVSMLGDYEGLPSAAELTAFLDNSKSLGR